MHIQHLIVGVERAVGVQEGCFAFRSAQEPNKTNTVEQQGRVSSGEQIILR